MTTTQFTSNHSYCAKKVSMEKPSKCEKTTDITPELQRLRGVEVAHKALLSLIDGLSWYWISTDREYSHPSVEEALDYIDSDGNIIEIERGGVVEVVYAFRIKNDHDDDTSTYQFSTREAAEEKLSEIQKSKLEAKE